MYLCTHCDLGYIWRGVKCISLKVLRFGNPSYSCLLHPGSMIHPNMFSLCLDNMGASNLALGAPLGLTLHSQTNKEGCKNSFSPPAKCIPSVWSAEHRPILIYITGPPVCTCKTGNKSPPARRCYRNLPWANTQYLELRNTCAINWRNEDDRIEKTEEAGKQSMKACSCLGNGRRLTKVCFCGIGGWDAWGLHRWMTTGWFVET